MRIYKQFTEALPEIQRDLVEMGIKIHPDTYQDKYVKEDPNFDAFEVSNYIYSVVDTNSEHLTPTQPWANGEFAERMVGAYYTPVNPGVAWLDRKEVWKQFLQRDGTFAYTYGERLAKSRQLIQIVDRLKADPDSRQGYISIWDPNKDPSNLGGVSRVPCSLGYYFQVRKGKLNMTYLQRSADFATHFVNDIYLAVCLQEWVAEKLNIEVGIYTHWLGSLHIFAKDAEGVF